VHDRVVDHEMPPKKKKQPEPAQAEAFLKTLAGPLISADQQREAAEGRSLWRRLNRYEYENAVRDLLDAPWLQIRDMLPEDGESPRGDGSNEGISWQQIKVPFLVPHQFFSLRDGFMFLWLARVADTIPTYAPAYYQVDKLMARARRNPYFQG